MAELIFDSNLRLASRMMTDRGVQGYKIYTVNGSEPAFVGRSIFVPGGDVTADMQYIQAGSGHTNVFGRQTVHFAVQNGKQYKIGYNILDGKFTCKEK